MSLFFPKQKRSYYQVIDDGAEEDDDPLSHINHRSAPQTSDVEHGLPPSIHQAEVSFEGGSGGTGGISTTNRDSELTNSNSRWDHIESPDQFFTLVYEYHQGNGLLCIILRHCFALFQFVLVVSLSTFLMQCVDYDVLFNNKNVTSEGNPIIGKRHIGDAIIPQCTSHFNPIIVLALILAVVFWTAHLLRVGYRLLQLYEVQTFYHNVLEISDADLSSIPWKDVVQRICKTQPQVHLIVNQEQITPLDIYQRILRYKNYMIAFVDNDVVPLHIQIPFVGKISYLSSGLYFNLEWLLFLGPLSPWKNEFALKDDYKSVENLELLADSMRTTITWMGLANLLFFPFVFLYQILFSFFSYADIVRRDPGILGSRKYSNHGRLLLRHYNELDHELNSRLNRSYEFAVRYMDQFISATAEIIAKTVAFTCGSIFAILFVLSVWDEDVLQIEHVLTVMTISGAIGLGCRSFIPNENMVFCQNFLMRQIVANVHYAPSNWIREGQSHDVYAEFSRIFQLKAQYFVEELFSPIVTPFMLLFKIRNKASDIVMFYHQNTRSCYSIGDICSYSMMDLGTDGDPRLSSVNPTYSGLDQAVFGRKVARKRHAKVELSLMNFVTQNPDWKPPPDSEELVRNIRDMWSKDVQQLVENQQMTASGAFGPLAADLSMLVSTRQSAENPRSSTPPPSPTTSRQTGSQRTQQHQQQSDLMASSAGIFQESAVAALSASSMMKSMQQSSIIQTPAARYYGHAVTHNVQERDLRALEMSMNALAITDMLMSRANGRFNDQQPRNYGSSSTAPPSIPSTLNTPFRPPASSSQNPPPTKLTTSRPAAATIASNIWGVPEESTMLDASDDDTNDDLEHIGRGPDDNHDFPPSAFNV